MKAIYIDNSIFSREQDWSSIAALKKYWPELRVVISDWHLVELASGTDRAQAFARADFVDTLKPLWMRGYLPIQQCEVKQFTWRRHYCVAAEEVCVFTEYLSEVWSDYVRSQTVIGLNARKSVAINRDLSAINSQKSEIVEVLNTLQAATAQQKKLIEQEVFLRWVLPRINDRDPDGKVITKAKKMEIANFCYTNKTEFYSSCPAIAVEDKLHKMRSLDANRQPKESDAIDLFHGVLALSYCDYYVTRDGFARHCAISAKRALPSLRTAKICASMNDLSAAVG